MTGPAAPTGGSCGFVIISPLAVDYKMKNLALRDRYFVAGPGVG
jgi:hypothetical protein